MESFIESMSFPLQANLSSVGWLLTLLVSCKKILNCYHYLLILDDTNLSCFLQQGRREGLLSQNTLREGMKPLLLG